MAHLMARVIDLPVTDAGTLFATALAVHVLAALVAIITGAAAATARKRPGRHPRSGTIHHGSPGVVFASATTLSRVRGDTLGICSSSRLSRSEPPLWVTDRLGCPGRAGRPHGGRRAERGRPMQWSAPCGWHCRLRVRAGVGGRQAVLLAGASCGDTALRTTDGGAHRAPVRSFAGTGLLSVSARAGLLVQAGGATGAKWLRSADGGRTRTPAP